MAVSSLAQYQQIAAQRQAAARQQALLQTIAAQQGASRRGLAVSPMVRQSAAAAARQPAAPKALAQHFDDLIGGSAAPDDGGVSGLLGGLMGNRVVKGILKPLDILDTPRRVVLSGINEAADALNGGDASWSDFTEQVGDSSFGFGDVVGETGNKWLDRAIGFAGDVAFDPTTYLTLGSSKLIGSAGRAALAGEAAAKGLGEEAVSRLARLGEAGLAKGEREALELGKGGLRFGTPGHNVRIPGTENLSKGLQRATAAVRAPLTDTWVGRSARAMGGGRSEVIRPFVERLATGKGDVSAVDAANLYAARLAEQAAGRGHVGRFNKAVRNLSRAYTGRDDLTHAIETGALSSETDAFRQVQNAMFKEARDNAGVSALKEFPNHVPHYQTPELQTFLRGAPEADETLFHGARMGESGSGRLHERVFRPNSDVTIHGQTIHIDDGSIRDITTKLQDAFPQLRGKKLIEDDPSVWLPRLLEEQSRDVGEAAFEKRLQNVGGDTSLWRADDPDVLTTVPDPVATKQKRDQVLAQVRADQQARRKQLSAIGAEIKKRVKEAGTTARTAAKEGVASAKARNVVADQYMNVVSRDQAAARKGLAATEAKLGTEAGQNAHELMQAYMRLDQLDGRLDELSRQWFDVGGITAGRQQAWQAAVEERQRLVSELSGKIAGGQQAGMIESFLGEAPGMVAPRPQQQAVSGEWGGGDAPRVFAGEVEGPAALRPPEVQSQIGQVGTEYAQREVVRRAAEEPWRIASEAMATPSERFEQKLAGLASGRPVQSREEAQAVIQRMEGRQAPAVERAAREAVTTGAETGQALAKGTVPYGAAERAAAKRELEPLDLIKPDALPAYVVDQMPERVQQAWREQQAALDEMLRPYRTPEAQAAAEAGREAGRTTKEAAAREAWEQRKVVEDQITRGENVAKKVALNQGTASKQYRDIQKGLSTLRTKLADMKRVSPVSRTVESKVPLHAAMINDPGIKAAIRDAEDLAEFMARKYRALASGTPDTPELDRLVTDVVLTNRKKRIVPEAEKVREATGKLKLITEPGRNVPKYQADELEGVAEKMWQGHRARHDAAYQNWDRFEQDMINKGLNALGDAPTPPRMELPDRPSIFGVEGRYKETPIEEGSDLVSARYETADGRQILVDSPQEYLSVWKADYEAQMAKYEEVWSDYATRQREWRQARERTVAAMKKRAERDGTKVPKRAPAKGEFMAHTIERLRKETVHVPSMSAASATAEVDRAMSGRFRDIVSTLVEDVRIARSDKNKLDSAARSAGHKLPKTQRYASDERINALAEPLREMMNDPTIPDEEVQAAIDKAVNALNLDEKAAAKLSAQTRGTGGRFMPLEEWQQGGLPLGPSTPVKDNPGAAKARRDLREQLGLGGEDNLPIALTDMRNTARQRVDEAEREFMKTISTLTGTRWDQPRKAITRVKGGRATQWLMNGEEATIDDIRRLVSEASGLSRASLMDTQSPKRMLQKWAYTEYVVKNPLPPTATDDAAIHWTAHMGAKEEAINKMSEKQLMEQLDFNGRKVPLEHVKINRKLSGADQQAIYLNGMADEAYRYIDQGQAGRIQGLYDSMSPTAKARLYDHVAEQGKVLNRELTDTEIRLGNIDSAGRGKAATHDPIEMLLGSRTGGALSPATAEDALAQQRTLAMGDEALDILPQMADQQAGLTQAKVLAANLGEAIEQNPVSGINQAEIAALEQRLPETFVRSGGFIDPNQTGRMPGMGVPRPTPAGLTPYQQMQAEAVLRKPELRETLIDQARLNAEQQSAQIAAPWNELRMNAALEGGENQQAIERLGELIQGGMPLTPGGRPLQPSPNPVDLSDVGQGAARTTARQDIKALDQVRSELAQRASEEFANKARPGLIQGFEDRTATAAQQTALAQGADEQIAADLAKRQRLQGVVEGLGPNARAEGAAAAEQLENLPSVEQMAADRLREMRQPLGQEFTAVGNERRAVSADVQQRSATLKAMPAQLRTAVQPYYDTLNMLDGHETAALEHKYQAEKILADAQKVADSIPKNLPTKVRGQTKAVYDVLIDQTEKALGSAMPKESKDLLKAAAANTVQFDAKQTGTIAAKYAAGQRFIRDIKDGKVLEVTMDALDPAYRTYRSKVQGQDFAVTAQLDRAMRNLTTAFQQPTEFGKVVDAYTRFFKSYATANPGFHVRNALSATFMNSSDGVSFRNQAAGVRIWQAYEANPNGTWWRDLPARYRDVAQDVVKAVYASGAGGAFSAQEIGERAYGKGGRAKRLVNDNMVLRASRFLGERVEGSVRAGMALDTLLGGGAVERARGSVAEATTRINRIHFNYSDANKFDAQMRRIVPFYTFMSRNLPLQVQQMWTNPRTYLHWQSFERNFRSGENDSDLPQWMRQGGAFRIGENTALMPDIGANQLQRAIEQVSDPSQMLSQLTPALKVPLSLTTKRNFFYDEPYEDNQFEKVNGELAMIAPVLAALGLTKDIPGQPGETAVPTMYGDAVRDLIPTLGQVNRADKGMQSLLNFLGIPVKQLTPEVMAGERRRKEFERTSASRNRTAERQALAEL